MYRVGSGRIGSDRVGSGRKLVIAIALNSTMGIRDLNFVNEARWLFSGHFWPLWKQAKYSETARSSAEIVMSLKSNPLGQENLVSIPDTHCTMYLITFYNQVISYS